jgi:hypothetical protein
MDADELNDLGSSTPCETESATKTITSTFKITPHPPVTRLRSSGQSLISSEAVTRNSQHSMEGAVSTTRTPAPGLRAAEIEVDGHLPGPNDGHDI